MSEDRFKFRVWDKEKKDWIGSSDILKRDFYISSNGEVAYGVKGVLTSEIDLDNHTIQQCTGLKDKNGKLIFEGDILSADRYKYIDDGKQNYIGVVEFENGHWLEVSYLVNKNKKGISHNIGEYLEIDDQEVIGNIFENKDLLEQEK